MEAARPESGALALIFDMDGVLVHSTPIHNLAWQVYLRRHGIYADLPTIEAAMLGKHNADIVRSFFGGGLSPDEVARHGADKEIVYRELMRPRLAEHLVPGVAQFLERHRNDPMALATNAEPENVEFILDGSGFRSYFRAVIDGHQVERPKPAPEIYFRAASLLGVPAMNCIVFEDSGTGVEAAKSAGARVVGLATTAPALEGCDLLISDFLDPRLAPWLATLK